MFGDADALIQIDMSEYMEKFTASRLIGSPPGYVGYEEGDNCPKPFEGARIRSCSSTRSKAHPDVMHLLLQILEEGKITDSLGRKIDFRNTIIIMTSNVGAELIRRQTTLGFGAAKSDDSYDVMRIKFLKRLSACLSLSFSIALTTRSSSTRSPSPILLRLWIWKWARSSSASKRRIFT